MKENLEKKSLEKSDGGIFEETLRRQIKILLKSEIEPLEDKEFRRFLARHRLIEGDVKKVIDEEKEKLALEEKKKEQGRKYYKTRER